jgi:hypothetical protein
VKISGTAFALPRCRRIKRTNTGERTVPIILWLLGVPLSLVIVLALLGVF